MTHAPDRQGAGEPLADMTLASAQRAVDASIMALGGYWPPLANLARLFEECGELARVINQAHGPKRVKPGERQAELEEEVGDALYTLLVLANSLGVDASAALRKALMKSEGRAQPPVTPPGAPTETDL
jgi:NTP pyrophosphatase (non-canonical NTP hydrolase)